MVTQTRYKKEDKDTREHFFWLLQPTCVAVHC